MKLRLDSFFLYLKEKYFMLSNRTKIARWLELLSVYIGIPLLLKFDILPVYKLVPLFMVFLFYLFVLLRDKTFKRKQFRLNGFDAWIMILWRTVIMLLFLLLFTRFVFPSQYFELPLTNKNLWLLLVFTYPFLSVIPQEFVFRVYFYHRFQGLIGNRNILILLNALLFSFSHIMFENWVALVLTFIASILFSLTYLRYRSFTIVVLEHAIYGVLIFTIGPGAFFHNF